MQSARCPLVPADADGACGVRSGVGMTRAAEPLRVSVLRPVRAGLGSREVPLGTARQILLFALLAVP